MKHTLFRTDSLSVETARFAAGERQPRHRDPRSRITLAVHGEFHEEAERAASIQPGDVIFKSRRATHEDRYGPGGARLVSIVFHDDSFDAPGAPSWRVRRDGVAFRLALSAWEAALARDDAGVTAASFDLLARREEPEPRATPPRWLNRLKQALESESLARVNVAREARAAGVHPAHASRLFRRCFGASITEHAQAHCVRRALGFLSGAAPLSHVAIAAGFYDQSHMNRIFRRVAGRTPGACRALMAAC